MTVSVVQCENRGYARTDLYFGQDVYFEGTELLHLDDRLGWTSGR